MDFIKFLAGAAVAIIAAFVLYAVYVTGYIWTVTSIGVVCYLLFFLWKKKRKNNDNDYGYEDEKLDIYGPGIKLGWFTSPLFFFTITAGAAAAIVTIFYWLPRWWLGPPVGSSTIFDLWLPISWWLSLSILPWLSTEQRRIPNEHSTLLKVAGSLWNVELTTAYHNIPLYPFFQTNRDDVIGEKVYNSREQDPDDPGLIYTGKVTVTLGGENDNEPLMTATAADNARVKLRPTFNWVCVSPRQRIRRNRPISDLNEATRTVVRDLFGGLASARQLNLMQGGATSAVSGRRIYFVRTRRSDAARGVHGSDMVINNATRRVMYALNNKKGDYEDKGVAQTLLKEVLEKGDRAMLDAASEKPGKGEPYDHNTIEVSSIFVADRLLAALLENGYGMFGEPRFGEIAIPGKVIDAADQAAAEVEERNVAVATAETAKVAAAVYETSGLSKPDAAMVAAAKETPDAVQVRHITGTHGTGIIVNAN